MNITLTNNEIYNYANALAREFNNNDIKLPIKVNFYLQKNMQELMNLAQEIERQRIAIAEELGTLNEETQSYDIPDDKIYEAGERLQELFDLTQDVKVYKVKIDAFGETELTAGQMQALLFMIDEEE